MLFVLVLLLLLLFCDSVNRAANKNELQKLGRRTIQIRNMDLTLEIDKRNLRATRFNTQKCNVIHKECILILFIYISVSKTFFYEPSWLRKITTNPHTVTHLNINCPGGGCPKLKMCISELV
jgi:hypothetical protein